MESSIEYQPCRKSILVVDDDGPARKLLATFLYLAGYDVKFASNGMEAIDRFEDDQVDLVLTDSVMPGLTGSTMAEVIKELRPDTPVLMITEAQSPVRTDRVCVDATLTRPLNADELLSTVTKLLWREWAVPKASPDSTGDQVTYFDCP